jgi:uncharacterized repeat protein (TIGR01451 family)
MEKFLHSGGIRNYLHRRLWLYPGLLISLLAGSLLALGAAGAKNPDGSGDTWAALSTPPQEPAGHSGGEAAAAARHAIATAFRTPPIVFEANRGQVDSSVRFLSRAGGHTLFLTDSEAILMLAGPSAPSATARPGRADATATDETAILRVKLVGANRQTRVVGGEKLPGTVNYLLGDDPARWHRNIPTYARVTYAGIYPGVDLIYHGTHGRLEYDFVLAPGANPGAIALHVEGAQGLAVSADGDLILAVPGGELRMHKPYVYQDVDGRRRAVDAGYALHGDGRIGFRVAAYDARQALVIDPVLGYSTYLGGSKGDQALGIAVDGSGFAYVTGKTASTNFPSSGTAFQKALSAKTDVFVTKIDTNAIGADSLMYSTYVGGSQDDAGNAIALEPSCVSNCAAYVTGRTVSTANFPAKSLKAGNKGGSDAFVFKLKPDGTGFEYSVYLGGSADEVGSSIAVNAAGNAYVTGLTTSSNFPVTPGAFKTALGGTQDAFVTKLDGAGSAVDYSTYLGGNGIDAGHGIAVLTVPSATDFVYVTGSAAGDFPVKDAYQANQGGNGDAFVSILQPAGQSSTDLVYSTYLGGSGMDIGTGIAVDGSGDAYVTGSTTSPGSGTVSFPTENAYQSIPGGSGKKDAFVVRLDPGGANQLVYSTYVGGSGDDVGNSVTADGLGNAYVTGQVSSAVLPVPPPPNALDPQLNGPSDAFVARFNTTSAGPASLAYFTYLGGGDAETGNAIALDARGTVYLAGETFSASNAPFLTLNGWQGGYGGSGDAFVATLVGVSFASDAELSISKTGFPDVVAPGGSVTYALAVANNGPSIASAVTVNDSLPASVTFVSAFGAGWSCSQAGNTVTCSRPSLAVGPAPVITIAVTAPAAIGTITNTASVGANEIDSNPTNNTATVTTTVNTRPTATVSLAPPLPRTNDTLTATATSADPDGDAVTLTYVWRVNGITKRTVALSTAASDAFELGIPGNGDRGDVVTVEVTPNDGTTSGTTVSASVTVANSAPSLSANDQVGTEGVLLTFQVSVTDLDAADPLVVSASDLPSGASFDAGTRTFAWTPSFAQGGPSPYYVQFTVSDGQLIDVKTVKLTIAGASRPDRDGDSVLDDSDNCPDDPNPTQLDVCHTTSPASAAVALAAPGNAGGSLIFNLNVTTGNTPMAWVAPGSFTGTVSCRIFDDGNTEQPGQRVPEIGVLVVTDDPGGDLIAVPANTSVTLSTAYDYRVTHPDLPEGRYTFACEYRNHTPAINPEPGEVPVWVGHVEALATTLYTGQYVFGGFSSPAPFQQVNRGRALPFKFSLQNSGGAFVSTCRCQLSFVRIIDGQPSGPETPAAWKDGSPGNAFRYDFTANAYQLNADTGPLTVGIWRGLARLDNGATQAIDFIVTGQTGQ